jgi:hypothetical protein
VCVGLGWASDLCGSLSEGASPAKSFDERVSGSRATFVDGEQQLSSWKGGLAYVGYRQHERPWELEDRLIALLDLPLNLDGNSRNAFHPELTRVRRGAVAEANLLPVVPNPGVGGR